LQHRVASYVTSTACNQNIIGHYNSGSNKKREGGGQEGF
jgi:hypothetical protein